MVEVKFELEGMEEAEAQTVLLKMLRFYQQALGDVACPTHGKAPWLLVKGSSPVRLAVSIEACCEALAAAANARLQTVSRREGDHV
jgi:hypothetical protein